MFNISVYCVSMLISTKNKVQLRLMGMSLVLWLFGQKN